MSTPILSIIVSMHHRTRASIDVMDALFFPSLLRNASPDWELIVVDDASPLAERTESLLSRHLPPLRERMQAVVHDRVPRTTGFAAAYNHAASLATGSFLLIVNNDVCFPSRSIDAMLAASVADPTIGAVGPVTNVANTYQHTSLFPRLRDYRDGERRRIEDFSAELSRLFPGEIVDFPRHAGPSGFCVMVPRRLFTDIGGFDERYRYGMFEDNDLNMKIESRGLRRVLLPSVFVEHGGPTGAHTTILSQPMKAAGAIVINGLRFTWKWRRPRLMLTILVSLLQEHDICCTITRSIRRARARGLGTTRNSSTGPRRKQRREERG